MTSRRHPPFPATPPTTRLLRAVGDRQQRRPDHAPVGDLRALGRSAVMIAVGVQLGYLEVDEQEAVGLTVKGVRWYLHDLERRT